jgi:hypothetical protein
MSSITSLTLKRLSFCLLLFSTSSFARIGENEQQIATRYGTPIRTVNEPALNAGGTTKMYKAAGLEIVVTFIGGVSEQEYYAKAAQARLDRSEVQTLLDSNAGSKQWKEIDKGHPLYNWHATRWMIGDLSQFTVADFNEINGRLSIMSKKFLDAQAAASDAAAREKLKGF